MSRMVAAAVLIAGALLLGCGNDFGSAAPATDELGFPLVTHAQADRVPDHAMKSDVFSILGGAGHRHPRVHHADECLDYRVAGTENRAVVGTDYTFELFCFRDDRLVSRYAGASGSTVTAVVK